MVKKLSSLLVAIALGVSLLAPQAHAIVLTDGLPEAGGAGGAGYDTNRGLTSIIGGIVAVVLSFLGVLFLLLVIYAGVLWMTAAGDPKQIQKAKDILTAAVIGLVIILAAYAITSTLTKALTNATTTNNSVDVEG
jgi:hypothetical protein